MFIFAEILEDDQIWKGRWMGNHIYIYILMGETLNVYEKDIAEGGGSGWNFEQSRESLKYSE